MRSDFMRLMRDTVNLMGESEAENAARSKPRRVTTLRPSVMWGLKERESILKPAARRSFESLSAISERGRL